MKYFLVELCIFHERSDLLSVVWCGTCGAICSQATLYISHSPVVSWGCSFPISLAKDNCPVPKDIHNFFSPAPHSKLTSGTHATA